MLLSGLLLCSACGKSQPTTPKQQGTHSSRPRTGPSLPAAPLGVYVGHYLGRDGQPTTKAAGKGVEAQVQLHKKFNPLQSDDTTELLTQFGTILQIDVPDMLNRSTDRPATLTQYTEALKNITTRAKRTAQDLTNHGDTLHDDEKKQQNILSDYTKQLNQAKRNSDLASLSALQKNIADTQGKIGLIRAEEQQTKDLLASYQNLIDISAKRQAAIEQNREVLIAGLKVVNIPGVENLGVLQGGSTRSGGSFLQGL